MSHLLGVTLDQKLSLLEYQGLAVFLSGHVTDTPGTVYASLLGRTTATSAIWAAFQAGTTLWTQDGKMLFRFPKSDRTTYHTLRTRLPQSNWLHLVILHSQATVHNLPGENFYLLSATPEPPLELFWAQWNNALSFPALPAWKAKLWERGQAAGIITPIPAHGTHCWRIYAYADEWAAIIQKIVSEVRRCHA